MDPASLRRLGYLAAGTLKPTTRRLPFSNLHTFRCATTKQYLSDGLGMLRGFMTMPFARKLLSLGHAKLYNALGVTGDYTTSGTFSGRMITRRQNDASPQTRS